MKKYVKWITTLNFRGTYGIQGNAVTRISPDLILNQGKVANLYNRYQSTISPNPKSESIMGTYQIMEFRCRPGIIQYVLYEFGILYKTIQCHC